MLWVVVAGIAMAVSVTVSLLAIVKIEPLTNGELAGILLALASIGIAIYIAFLQVRQTARMDKVIRRTKEREDRRKKQYLPRIIGHTEIIRKHFDAMIAFVAKYEKESTPDNWQIVINHSKFASNQIHELGKDVEDDFAHIYDLIEVPFVYYKYGDIIVYLSQFTFLYAVDLNPEVQGLDELKRQINEQVSKLDWTLTTLRDEMPKDEK